MGLMQKKKMVCIWVGKEVGRIWGELEEGKP